MKKFIKSAVLRTAGKAGYEVVPRIATPKSTLPSRFIATVPKSGSVFITRALAKTLSLSILKVSPGYFPSDNIDLTPMTTFHKGGCIAQTHVDPSPFNLSILSRFAAPWLVHFRDPRAALLSWTFHNERPDIYKNPFVALCVYPAPPDFYYTALTFEQKVDWQIANYYPALIAWIEKWCDVIGDSTYAGKIHATSHEELKDRDSVFVAQLIDKLWGIKPAEIVLPPKDMSSHFRTGTTDEWRYALTPRQIEKTTALITPRAKEMFGWAI